MYLADNLNLIMNLVESYFYSLYSSLAFLNILVDTAETYGIFMLVFVILIHQFNTIVFIYTNFTLFSDKNVFGTTNASLKTTSFSRLFAGSLLLIVSSM